MRREFHVRICEGLGVKFPGPTRRTGNGYPYRDTGLQEAIAMGIVSGSRIFIGSPEDFYKAAMGAGFVLAAHFDGTTRGESRVSS